MVTAETAEEYDLTEIGDLADVAGDLTLGGAAGVEDPPDRSARASRRSTAWCSATSSSSTPVARRPSAPCSTAGSTPRNLFTTDPNIAAEDLVVLEDPDALFAAQNVVPLLRSEVVDDTVTETLNSVSEALDTETLGELVTQVVIDKEDPQAVAEQFLADNDLA